MSEDAHQWGLIVGALLSLLLARGMRLVLYEVEPWEPVVMGGMALAFFAVGWLATVIPARRAAHVDPMVALRAE